MPNAISKAIITGVAALAIAGGAYAQSGPGAAPRGDGPRHRPAAEDVAAMTDARIAGLKAGLRLTPEQEKNWPALESALRDLGKERADRARAFIERREARRNAPASDNPPPRPDMLERLRNAADTMAARAAALKKLADAADPLYKSLDDGQKRRFAALLRVGRSGAGPMDWRRGPGGPR